MKTLILAMLFSLGIATLAVAEECPKAEELKELEKERKAFKAYKPPKPGQARTGGRQSGAMGTHRGNTNAAGNAAAACAGKLREFGGKFKKLKENLEDPACEKEKDKAKELEEAAEAKAMQCELAGGALAKQEDKSKGNEKDMAGGKGAEGGEKKGDEKKDGEGGGGGAPPPMPQPPPPKKDDSKEKEKKYKECKARAANTLEINKKNCELQFPYNPAMPVADQLTRQQDCKQSKIFSHQMELAECNQMQ